MFILLLFYYWLLVLASKGHNQASIKIITASQARYVNQYKNLKSKNLCFCTICTSILSFFVNNGQMMAF